MGGVKNKVSSYIVKRELFQQMHKKNLKCKPYIDTLHIPALTNNEISLIQNFWYPYLGAKVDFDFYSVVKYLVYNGEFNKDVLCQYISPSIMFPFIIPKLNPQYGIEMLQNKSLYPIVFHSFNKTHDIIRNIDGIFMSDNDIIMSLDQSIEYILEYTKPIIIKSCGSLGGRSVKLIHEYNHETLLQLFVEYNQNFVIQQVVEQNDQMASLCPTSLNTFRITTMLINGECSIVTKGLRHGKDGSIVDNADQGGRFVGINEDGSLKFAINTKGEKDYYHFDGRKYSDIRIKNFDKVLEFAKELHYALPICKFVGWDIGLDSNDNPIFIEANSKAPGVTIEQLADESPLFGNRLQEVLDYVFNG